MSIIKPIYIAIILAICTKACLVESCIEGTLTLENQSDYNIALKFYTLSIPDSIWRSINRDSILNNLSTAERQDFLRDHFRDSLLETVSIAQKGGIWQKKESDHRGTDIAAISILLSGPINSTDSAVIVYDNSRVQFHLPPSPWNNSNTTRSILDQASYKRTFKKCRFLCRGCNKASYHYVFTNADYESAKPIRDP